MDFFSRFVVKSSFTFIEKLGRIFLVFISNLRGTVRELELFLNYGPNRRVKSFFRLYDGMLVN